MSDRVPASTSPPQFTLRSVFWWMSAACVVLAVFAMRDRRWAFAVGETLLGIGMMLLGKRWAAKTSRPILRSEGGVLPFCAMVIGAIAIFHAPRLAQTAAQSLAQGIPRMAMTLADWVVLLVGATVATVDLLEVSYSRRWIPPLIWAAVCWLYLGLYAVFM